MGGRKETVSDDTILQIFVDTDDPVLSTTEVAHRLDFSNSGAWTRLDRLHGQGYVANKKAGQTNIWWITDAGEEKIN